MTRFVNFFRALVVVHDRNGDSVITSASNEYVVVDLAVGAFALADFALDPSDRAALLYFDDDDDTVYLAWDRSGDGDFNDSVAGTPELAALATGVATANCIGVGFAPDGDPVAIYASSGTGTIFLRDHDQDGDVDGAGEVLALDAGAADVCDLEADNGHPVAVFHDLGSRLNLLVDRDDNGDFDGVDEAVDLGSGFVSHGALDENVNGVPMLATGFTFFGAGSVFVDPTP